jgi:two-component system phosphate regulon sensor histidine kinase PhoR
MAATTLRPAGHRRVLAARPRHRLTALAAASQTIAAPRDMESLMAAIYAEIARAVDATIFVLGLYDQASQTVHVVKQVISGAERPGGSFPLGSGFTSEAIRTGQPRLIRRWSQEGPPVSVRYAADGGRMPESGITVPLLWGGQAVGVLLVQSYTPCAYDDEDLAVLRAIAAQAALAIVNLRHSADREAHQRSRAAELEVILASMADALVILDRDGRIVRINQSAREQLCPGDNSVVLGLPLDSQRWDRWPDGPRAIAAALRPAVDALRRGESLREVDVDVELPGCGRRVISYSCGPLCDPAGSPAGGVVVFRDVTERRELERLKDDVFASASHDLRTPIACVGLRIQMLERRLSAGRLDDAALSGALQEIRQQVDRTAEQLRLLLDVARLQAGHLPLERETTDLGAVASAVLDEVGLTTDRHQLTLRASPGVVGAWDEWRLREVLQNLLTNAVKYSPDGGPIEVTVEADECDATVRVRDPGVGLPAEELSRVFTRFYRSPGARRLEGSGLGLYICQTIVDAHGGRIWAESDGPGRGSAFCFSLPRAARNLDPGAGSPA